MGHMGWEVLYFTQTGKMTSVDYMISYVYIIPTATTKKAIQRGTLQITIDKPKWNFEKC